ncbi:hypothetical protein ACI79J_15385 [Geodermatophilus sp. SYSU D01062]
MSESIAHHGLRHLIRTSGNPEVRTNDLLQSLLDGDRAMREAFLEFLSHSVGADLRRCRIEREAYEVDALTGKKSYRDFLLTEATTDRCIIETKIDSVLTSHDQARRYLEQLPPGGALMIVTRKPLVPALTGQAEGQLGVRLSPVGSAARGEVDGRTVLVMSWSDLLRGVLTRDGRPFEELVALDLALEGISDFVPFTAAVEDVAVGRLVQQAIEVADEICSRLPRRLSNEGVTHDSVSSVRKKGYAPYVNITILNHTLWIGYDAGFWAKVPGDGMPSPIWAGRWNRWVRKADLPAVTARRNRLDALGVTRPFGIPLGLPLEAVVERILDDAVAHVRRISTRLHADPAARGGPMVDEEAGDDGDPADR